MDSAGIADYANGILIIVTGLLAYFGIKRGRSSGGEDEHSSAPTVQIAGALVDSRSVEKLSGEVAGQSLAITSQVVALREQTEAIKDQTRAMRDLHQEVRDLSDLTRAITDLGTQVSRMK
ncbi:hypothetical protein DYI37_03025 [Fulvimarina endophytica]|uniref:Uncharacterized protein n=1 Tax=Fulvimarina endophytica TaxID=2293836 RepID=A0A371XB42_9HYPH|nr:hypothetical protein [Fulvimarina endophytica]RFC66430.1 hypothetical protein DYI37_03025 [Fulvimarina endophytica]